MYKALPSAPPISTGNCTQYASIQQATTCSGFECICMIRAACKLQACLPHTWHVTHNVWHSWVLPLLNSPYISVIEPVSIPPAHQQGRVWSLMAVVCRYANAGVCTHNAATGVGQLTFQYTVQLFAPSCDVNDLGTLLCYYGRRCKSHGHKLPCCRINKQQDELMLSYG